MPAPSSVYNPQARGARVNLAARALKTGKGLGTRAFDTCFEMGDADAVVAGLVRRSRKDAALEAGIRAHLSLSATNASCLKAGLDPFDDPNISLPEIMNAVAAALGDDILHRDLVRKMEPYEGRTVAELQSELQQLEAGFAEASGRGVALADDLDALRATLAAMIGGSVAFVANFVRFACSEVIEIPADEVARLDEALAIEDFDCADPEVLERLGIRKDAVLFHRLVHLPGFVIEVDVLCGNHNAYLNAQVYAEVPPGEELGSPVWEDAGGNLLGPIEWEDNAGNGYLIEVRKAE